MPETSRHTEIAIAKMLLEVGAVVIRPDEPFRYTSGMLSPIYVDNRVLISYPDIRKRIAQAMADMIREHFRGVEAIAGTSTAGIAWAAWISAYFNIPMVYVRDRSKRHGQKNQIEGVLKASAQTIVTEDLITTGGSALNSVQAVRKAGATPLAVVAIFTYGTEAASEAFKKAGVSLYTLTNFATMVDTAGRQGLITTDSQDRVLDWATDPGGWGQRMGLE